MLLTVLFLALSLPAVVGTHAMAANVFLVVNTLPLVQHPLVYHPSSLSIPGSPPYIPSDIQKAYDYSPLYARGIDGNGTRIALVDAYGDPTLTNDVSTFDSLTGLPSPAVNLYYPDGSPRFRNSGWALETALDVEWAHAIAPGATIDVVVAPDSSLGHIYDGISYVANTLTNETVLSMSFGLSESQYPATGSYTIAAHHQLFTTITSHGTTVFASSGDSGASACCDVSYPASDPLIVAIGGTSLQLDNSSSYVSETAWSGSGAGSSLVFTKPSWQQNLGDSMRDIADVSYDADPNTGVLVVDGGQEYEVGGTSAGSPQWAALTALASQAANSMFGSIASRLYNLSSYYDVTLGSDGFFSAGAGWDYPTGLGTPDATSIVSGLVRSPVLFHDSNLFQGLNVTAGGSLVINDFTMRVSGAATVEATNSSTGTFVYSNNYTLSNIVLQNETSSQVARFLLSIPVSPYALSTEISLAVHGTNATIQVMTTRRVNISGENMVNLNDVSIVFLDFDRMPGSPGYNPLADLAATGTIGLVDVGITTLYFDSPVF
jgi:subtilase family serine protease